MTVNATQPGPVRHPDQLRPVVEPQRERVTNGIKDHRLATSRHRERIHIPRRRRLQPTSTRRSHPTNHTLRHRLTNLIGERLLKRPHKGREPVRPRIPAVRNFYPIITLGQVEHVMTADVTKVRPVRHPDQLRTSVPQRERKTIRVKHHRLATSRHRERIHILRRRRLQIAGTRGRGRTDHPVRYPITHRHRKRLRRRRNHHLEPVAGRCHPSSCNDHPVGACGERSIELVVVAIGCIDDRSSRGIAQLDTSLRRLARLQQHIRCLGNAELVLVRRPQRLQKSELRTGHRSCLERQHETGGHVCWRCGGRDRHRIDRQTGAVDRVEARSRNLHLHRITQVTSRHHDLVGAICHTRRRGPGSIGHNRRRRRSR